MEFEELVDATLKRQRIERIERQIHQTVSYLKLSIGCFLTIFPFFISMWIYYRLSTARYSWEEAAVAELMFCVAIIPSIFNLRQVYQFADIGSFIETGYLNVLSLAIPVLVHSALFTTETLDLLRLCLARVPIAMNVFYISTHLAITFSVYSTMAIAASFYFMRRSRIEKQVFRNCFGDTQERLKYVTQGVAIIYTFYALVIMLVSLTTPQVFVTKNVNEEQALQKADVNAYIYGGTAFANLLLIFGLHVGRQNVPEFTLRRANLLLVLTWICLTILMTAMEVADIYLWVTGAREMPITNCKAITVLIVAKIGVINYGMVSVICCYCQELHALVRVFGGSTIRTNRNHAADVPMPFVFVRGAVLENARNIELQQARNLALQNARNLELEKARNLEREHAGNLERGDTYI